MELRVMINHINNASSKNILRPIYGWFLLTNKDRNTWTVFWLAFWFIAVITRNLIKWSEILISLRSNQEHPGGKSNKNFSLMPIFCMTAYQFLKVITYWSRDRETLRWYHLTASILMHIVGRLEISFKVIKYQNKSTKE